MKKLGQLIAGALTPALYLLTGNAHVEDIGSRLKDASYNFFFLDGSRIRSKDEFFSVVAETISFPGYFGNNWEAFADCITDMSWIPGGIGNVIMYDNFQLFAASDPQGFTHAYAGLVYATNRGTAPVPCYVLMRGDPTLLPKELPRLAT